MSSTAGLVVVGASLAGLRAVEGARKAGYQGPVTLVGAEAHLPYDRPPLSKRFLDPDSDPEAVTHRSADELGELDVQLRFSSQAIGLDAEAEELQLNGETLSYDALVIATGATARQLPHDYLPGVHPLRTLEDAQSIRRGLDGARSVLIVGGGFIGSEVASAARKRGLPVTIVEAAPLPLARAVGEEMAGVCAGLHWRHGTRLRCGITVEDFEGDDRVERAVLSDGSSIDADLVVVGVGAEPTTGWLEGSGLRIDDGVLCNETLCAGPGNVFAAGDVARWKNKHFDRMMRLEHWTSSAEQGALAGRNAANPAEATTYETVPYFWSDWYEHRLQMVGIPQSDEVRLMWKAGDDRWLALYREDDRLVGALGLNMQSKIMKLRAMIKRHATWGDALKFCDEKLRDLL
ncbi:NAD(P)/FAD-dependent oxidoreductase [Nocardioides caldifontis]|uniref:NAD(P)/FAD-dependent oxidoreductase n=1 Tax=Nocardioides caldifontis TaxID=2588938 RepID=UPI0011E0009C|nr:FAD-dependent oxidoreductase [Nocardioides caldifontis]